MEDEIRVRITPASDRKIRAAVDYKKKFRKDLSDYLDIVQDLLTFAEELPEKKRQELLAIIDKMIEHYKELEEDMEKVVGMESEQWSRVPLQ